jgi:SAM-dependent methyltransferase
MENQKSALLSEVASYYSNRLAEHGETPLGVDWNGQESQLLRFEQLCRIFEAGEAPPSVTDLGCGYGALLDYLHSRHTIDSYLGVDVSEEMVFAAVNRNVKVPNARFTVGAEPDSISDYVLASGIFNVRLGRSDDEWFQYLSETLDILSEKSRKGFAFNCLTSYSDEEKKRDYLYYPDPCRVFDFCKRKYSKQVALLHDYGLYEFTILVRSF